MQILNCYIFATNIKLSANLISKDIATVNMINESGNLQLHGRLMYIYMHNDSYYIPCNVF